MSGEEVSDERLKENQEERDEELLKHRVAFQRKLYQNLTIQHGAVSSRSSKEKNAYLDLIMFLSRDVA